MWMNNNLAAPHFSEVGETEFTEGGEKSEHLSWKFTRVTGTTKTTALLLTPQKFFVAEHVFVFLIKVEAAKQ